MDTREEGSSYPAQAYANEIVLVCCSHISTTLEDYGQQSYCW